MSLGCSSLPAPVSTFPKTIDVIEIAAPKDAAERSDFGWPAAKGTTSGRFSRHFSIKSEFASHDVQLSCDWELEREAPSCASVVTRCKVDDRKEAFSVELQEDGSVAVTELNVRPGVHGEELQLIAMNDEEIRGVSYRNSSDAPLLLPANQASTQDEEKQRWGIQLARTRPDPKSGESSTTRFATDDPEFNLLTPIEGDAYVAVHAAHPDYELASAILVTVGHLYVHNARSFSPCAN